VTERFWATGPTELALEISVRCRASGRPRARDVPARLRVAGQIVHVEQRDKHMFQHGRFDTALGWGRSAGESHAFRLSAADGQQLDLTVAAADLNEIRKLEQWLHMDE